MVAVISKKEHNRRNYEKHSPFPVRLGILKDIIFDKAFDLEQAGHWLIIRTLEDAFWPQVMEKAKEVATCYKSVLRLVKLDMTLKESLQELRIDEKLFIIGITDEQVRELCRYIKENEQERLRQKKGYYSYSEGFNRPQLVFPQRKRKVVLTKEQLRLF